MLFSAITTYFQPPYSQLFGILYAIFSMCLNDKFGGLFLGGVLYILYAHTRLCLFLKKVDRLILFFLRK